MRKYVHWLKVNGYARDVEKQIEQIKEYLKYYKDSKCSLYFPNSGRFDSYIRLECNQAYDDLDLDVNSLSTNITRLTKKPNGIYKSQKAFEELCG